MSVRTNVDCQKCRCSHADVWEGPSPETRNRKLAWRNESLLYFWGLWLLGLCDLLGLCGL